MANGVAIRKTVRAGQLRGISAGALILALAMPGAALAQAAQIPATASPGTPTHTDPSPAQTAVVPTTTEATPQAADGAAVTAPQQDGDGAAPDIVVTGFRRSLDAALNVKRESVSSVDAIVAEDIAKFPDQNLAESLQRIPGISIQRDAGEGRAITVRGLGAQFTRVRVNGLETVATSTDGASSNRDRAVDFNVFASELFNSIVVHKTAEASLDEGSLGAVVDLNTGNPLGGKTGFTGVLSAQASYNDLSKNTRPRLAGLLSYKSPDGTFGASVSAAYQKTDNLELGNNTVRWAQARFDSVNGTPCFYNSNTGTTPVANAGGFYRSSAACDQAALAFHPRIPRYGEVFHGRERLGSPAASNGRRRRQPRSRSTASIRASRKRAKRNGRRCCCVPTSVRSTSSTPCTIRRTTSSQARSTTRGCGPSITSVNRRRNSTSLAAAGIRT